MKARLTIDNATALSGSDGPPEPLNLQFSRSRSGTFDNLIVRKAFLETVPRQKILDELIALLQKEAPLIAGIPSRNDRLYDIGAEEWLERVRHHWYPRAHTPSWTLRRRRRCKPGWGR